MLDLSRMVSLYVVLCLAGVTACSSGRSGYLQDAVEKATEQDVQKQFGRPDHKTKKDAGQTVWIYQDCPPPLACYVWYLTFDREQILRSWERAPEHL